ncbi:hypothetical protein HanIR_Chr17g0855491 [Helianthus annuus]|nr:hypothetical protein HanIR_Chr17g0855491 [Helianthus annuus]
MPQPSSPIFQILPAQKLFRIRLLHLPINIVQKHMRHTGFLPISRHHSCRINRSHPTWRLRIIPFGRINHYHIPLLIVHHIRQPTGAHSGSRR